MEAIHGKKRKLLVLNGPNLNLLGMREPEIYGRETYEDLCAYVQRAADEAGVEIEFFQSNYEGALVDSIQDALGCFDGIILNPAAYTHTSIAILDALMAVPVPAVEVHLSDPDLREPFRRVSYVRSACIATVKGQGFSGYVKALSLLIAYLEKNEKEK